MPFPLPQDPAAAARLSDEFAQRAGIAQPAADSPLGKCLASLGGNSPFLGDLALRDPELLLAVLRDGPDAALAAAFAELQKLQVENPREDIARGLRLAKRRVALIAALADLDGTWGLTQVTGALSALAEHALRISVAHLLAEAATKGELSPIEGGGFTVLAMGKLGAQELNFSSDVDLILLYDPACHPDQAGELGDVFTRLARDLVTLMQRSDADGYVFRVDLRLRPDPASTAPAIALPAALVYYEGQAQTWERAAFIKARPVAGDLALGARFLDSIRPFIWRRHLDFAAIADIRAMKTRMDTHKGTALGQSGAAASRLVGHDVKLGEGGIREIEFCAQMLQLVWGGRNPDLRAPATVAALRANAAAGHLAADAVDMLADAYDFLRRLEHRLQMVADRQTHQLPTTLAGLARFAIFMGFDSADSFAEAALAHMVPVHTAFAGLLAAPPETADPGFAALPPRDVPESQGEVAEPPWVPWLAGRPRALRTERARALLADILPSLRATMQRQPDPAAAWLRLDDFIYRLPAGVQLFSLLRHNPALLDRLGDVLGAAPFLAEHLTNVPAAIEGLLSPRDVDPDPAATLALQLRHAETVDEALTVASRMLRGEAFRLAVAELEGSLEPDAAAEARSDLASAAIATLLPIVLRDHARRYGSIEGGEMAVLALGKVGSRAMMVGSDLDLMIIYDHPPGSEASDGGRALPPSQYFARAAQALIAALTVPTRDGPLYAVDMRLRPSGNQGPVAVSLPAFVRYHAESAHTWERLALTRARVVAAGPTLRPRVEAAMAVALRQGVKAEINRDTEGMRARVTAERPAKGPWDVKMRAGGLMDVEFIAQALQLHAADHPELLDPRTGVALAKLRDAGRLGEKDANLLIAADRAWRAIQGFLRITLGPSVPRQPPAASLPKIYHLLRASAGEIIWPGGLETPPTLSLLEQGAEKLAALVRDAFARNIGARYRK